MKTKHLVLFTFILLGFCVFAQEQEEYDFSNEQTYEKIEKPKLKHHSVYVELGGNSLFYSLNYDYTFSLSRGCKLAVGSGLSYFVTSSYENSDTPEDKPFLFVTPAVNFLFGKKSHHLEIGMSAINLVMPSARIGYRYQPAKGGFFFRIGYTPLFQKTEPYSYSFIDSDSDSNFHSGGSSRRIQHIPWAGISFGYTF